MMIRFLIFSFLFLLGVASGDQIRIDWRDGTTGNFSPLNLLTAPNNVLTFDATGLPIIGPGGGSSTSVATGVMLSAYDNLPAALTALGTTTKVRLIVDVVSPITAPATITRNIVLDKTPVGMLVPGAGVTLTVQGPITMLREQYFDTAASGSVVSFIHNNDIAEIYPEWWGARGNWGENGTEGIDSAPAFRAAIAAAKRTYPEFQIPGIANNTNPPWEMTNTNRTIKCSGGLWYRMNSTVDIELFRYGIFDGNGCNFIWRGNSTTPMFRLLDTRGYSMKDFRIASNAALSPLYAGITSENGPLTGSIPHHLMFSNITIEGRSNGGLQYGWIIATGAGGDFNNEMHNWFHCSVSDYAETAYYITHSQAKHNKFYGCTFNSGYFGKRGVALYHPESAGPNGSFAWYGGGGGGNTVADFNIATPLENILIEYAEIENSARFLTTGFTEVESGLVGTVPTPANLTMTTPAGSAWVATRFTPVVSPGFTHTYTASRDTYDQIGTTGTITHIAVANGAPQPGSSGTATWLQKVVTDATGIVSVYPMGGSYHPGGAAGTSPTTVIGCRYSRAAAQSIPWENEMITFMQRGPLTLIGNQWKANTGIAKFRVFGSNSASYETAKVTMIGNVFRENNVASIAMADRIIYDDGNGVTLPSAQYPTLYNKRFIALGNSYSDQAGTPTNLDVPGAVDILPQPTMATARLLGRYTTGTGAAEEIALSADLSLSGAGVLGLTNPSQPADTDLTDLGGLTAAQGDLIIGNGAGDWQKLIKGTAGQVLKMNAGATLPEWGAASGGGIAAGDSPTWTGAHTYTTNGAADTPVAKFTGTPFVGTATTSKALLLLEPTGATSTAWGTTGNMLGVNAVTGFAGNLINAQLNGVSRMTLASNGVLTTFNDIVSSAGSIQVSNTGFFKVGTFASLTSNGATNLRLGNAPSASPTSFSFTIGESSRPGTDSGVKGGDATIQSGLGTGTAGGASSLIFQTPTVNATATAVQTQTTRLTLAAAGATFSGDVTVPTEAYGAGWNDDLTVPTKDAVYEKIETIGGGAATARGYLTSNQLTASGTAVNITGMSFAIAANEVWSVEFWLGIVNEATGATTKFAIDVPTGATLGAQVRGTSSVVITADATLTAGTMSSPTGFVTIGALIQNGVNAGTVQLQFASGDGINDTSIAGGQSYFKATKMN